MAIATQTDRTAATQTEFITRSRSDNEESEEDPRLRRKSKLKAGTNRVETKEDFKKMKTIWVRTPIPEESRAQSGSKKATPTRTRIEVLESHKVSISPDVLKEISNSLKSGDSDAGNEDDEDEEAPLSQQQQQQPQAQVKPDKTRKVASKIVGTSQKKPKESRVDDTSTTPSPDTKEKKTVLKGKIRKKIEKPPRKKLQKSIEAEKSHFMEPSFRVLEREISSFQQKIRQFGDKKLKMLKKDEEDGKKDKESEDDEGAGYKKCEVTVTRTKKSVSRETSPNKISVEQKTKTSEEESCSKVEKISKPQQHTSSSDLEDFDKSKAQSTDHKERMTRCETSKMQTRSRSQFRRQTHMENSDTKSATDKTEKSEDSESKTENTKESSSSAETKTDSSSSRDVGKLQKQKENEKMRRPQTQEKKCVQSQKIMTRVRPTGTVDIKRKITSMRSKTVEKPTKRTSKQEERSVKSLTSDESRLTSPTKSKESVYHKKSETSEEDKSNRDSKSSTSKDSMAMNLDKFVKDVRGVVEKEISSFTQAAKDAFNINKSDSSADDKKQESSKNTLKQQDAHKVSMEMKEKSQSVDAAKRRSDMKSTVRERMFKSMESKDKKEKLKSQKEKSKSSESAMEQSDDAISFIVVSDHGRKHEDPLKDYEKRQDDHVKVQDDLVTSASDANISDASTKDVSKNISQKIDNTIKNVATKIDNTKDAVSGKIEETKQKISKSMHENTKTVSDNIEKADQTVSSKFDETKNTVTNEMSNVKQIESSFINNTNEAVANTIDGTKQAISYHIDKTHQIVSDRIDETEKPISDKIKETKKVVSDQIDETEKTISDEIKETKKVVSDQIDKTTQSVTHKIDETKKNVKDTIDETKKMVVDKIDETKKSISEKIQRSVSKSDDDGQMIYAERHVSAEKKEETTLETSKDLATNLVDTAVDASNKAVSTIQEKTEELDNTLSNTDLLKSESTSLPDEMKEEDEKNASKTPSAISANQMKEMKDAQSEEPNKNKISEEATPPGNIAEIKDMTKELLDMEKIDASKQSTSKTESITTLSFSSQEKETTSETTQMKQTKEPEQTPPEAPLNKEDSTSSSNANKGEEATAVATAESSTAMTQLKQTEAAAALHPTDKKDSASPRGNSDKTLETTTSQVSQKTQQGQTAAPEIAAVDFANKDKVVPGEKSESEMPKSPMKIPKKPILTITTTESTAEEETEDDDDDDTSSASDISSKTALRTQPYGTPRHSVSSDGEDHVAGKTLVAVKSDGKPRQKWNTTERDPLLKVEASQQQQQSREAASKAVFPQKIEVTAMDKPKSSASKTTPDLTKAPKSSLKESHVGVGHIEAKASEVCIV